MAELADAPDLGSGTERCGGSSPPFRTTQFNNSRFVIDIDKRILCEVESSHNSFVPGLGQYLVGNKSCYRGWFSFPSVSFPQGTDLCRKMSQEECDSLTRDAQSSSLGAPRGTWEPRGVGNSFEETVVCLYRISIRHASIPINPVKISNEIKIAWTGGSFDCSRSFCSSSPFGRC